MKHTLDELRQWQALPLSIKIRMTKERIRQWINEYGEDGVYVSFSGGKDSTVLLDLVRQDYPNVVAVFVDTGLEYPEIRNFVKTFDNVVWLKPKLTFKEVIKKYGYPFISKEIAQTVDEIKSFREKHDDNPQGYYRWKKLNGEAIDKKTGKPSSYNIPQWKFLLDSPYKISHKCCHVMKKNPAKTYEKTTNRQAITAQMACESRLRAAEWMKHGCNAFDNKRPISNPMSFWTEQDVLLYIKQYNIPICSVYGEIVEDTDGTNEVAGQMTISDLAGWENMELFDAERLPLKTTGCSRTGCMFCGFGCHLNNDQRFVKMKETHPKQYDYIMRPESEGGLNYKEIIDWINEHGNLNIKY